MWFNWMKRVTIQTVNTAVQPVIIIFGKMVPNLVVTIWCSGFPLLFPIPSRQTDHIWKFMWKKSPFWPNLKLSGGLKNWQERGGSQKSNLGGTNWLNCHNLHANTMANALNTHRVKMSKWYLINVMNQSSIDLHKRFQITITNPGFYTKCLPFTFGLSFYKQPDILNT